jgi:hypothetical protein
LLARRSTNERCYDDGIRQGCPEDLNGGMTARSLEAYAWGCDLS